MDNTSDTVDRDIGARLKTLRAAGGLTLGDLAERSGVSRAMLSRIERGESSPTAQLLNRVCAGLGVTLSSLFAAAETSVPPLSRRADQAVWRDPASGYQRRVVSPPGTGSPAEIIEVEFPPGAAVAFDSQRLANANQHVLVLEGTMEITIADETWRLEKGDSLHMRLDQAIGFRNPAERPARYLVVIAHAGGGR
jgi:transcriptional regulator with XRE-family HTH domain